MRNFQEIVLQIISSGIEIEKEVRKTVPLYFHRGIHKFDFPIWIQEGKSTLAEILRSQSDNC